MRLPILLFVLAWPALAAIPVQQAYNDNVGGGQGTTLVITFASTPAAGNLLTVQLTGNLYTVSGVTGGGATWALVKEDHNVYTTAIWAGYPASGSGSKAITITTSTGFIYGIVSEWSGYTATVDGTPVSNHATASTITTGTVTTTNANDLIIAVAEDQTTYSSGPTASFTALTSANAFRILAAYRVLSATGAYLTTWTFTTSVGYNTTIAAFKAIPVAKRKSTSIQPSFGPPPDTMLLFGDSITAGASLSATFTGFVFSSPTMRGWWNWAQIGLGQRFRLISNAGVGGNTTTDLLARISTDALAPKPGWVVVECVNDIAQDVATPTIEANFKSIYDQILANGSRLVVTTPPPSTSFNTSSRIQAFSDVKTWIQQYAATHSGVIVADFSSPYWVSLANPIPITNATEDGTHPTNMGGALLGKALSDAMNTSGVRMPAAYSFPVLVANLALNGTMVGTGGGTGTNASGSIAASWNVSGTGDTGAFPTDSASGVASKIARTDGIAGEWQQVVHTGMTPPQNVNARTSVYQVGIATGWAVGNTVQASVEWQADSNWVNMKKFYLQLRFIGPTNNPSVFDTYNEDDTYPAAMANQSGGIFQTPPTVIPAGTTEIQIFINFHADSGTYRIGRVELRILG